jgi:hypothetical protein
VLPVIADDPRLDVWLPLAMMCCFILSYCILICWMRSLDLCRLLREILEPFWLDRSDEAATPPIMGCPNIPGIICYWGYIWLDCLRMLLPFLVLLY